MLLNKVLTKYKYSKTPNCPHSSHLDCFEKNCWFCNHFSKPKVVSLVVICLLYTQFYMLYLGPSTVKVLLGRFVQELLASEECGTLTLLETIAYTLRLTLNFC